VRGKSIWRAVQRLPRVNVKHCKKRRTFLAHTSTEDTAFERHCCLSGISCDRAINTRDFIIIELLSSRKKYVAKYRRDTCKYNRRLQQGQIYDREMADSSKIRLESPFIRVRFEFLKRVPSCASGSLRESRGWILVDPETER